MFFFLELVLQKACSDTTGAYQWLIFDGPIEWSWIENLNSALDETAKLCLANLRQIALTKYIRFIFEVTDLEQVNFLFQNIVLFISELYYSLFI